MKTQPAAKRTGAMTLVEIVVILFVIAVLVLMLLPALVPHHSGPQRINCVNNLKEVGLAFKVWEGDNGGKYPMQISVTNGGAKELTLTGNVTGIFSDMSNELSTPKILVCPEDNTRHYATNFTTDFNRKKISYFVGLDANKKYPQMILDGDDNLAVNGVRVPPGILNLQTNASVAWTKERHHGAGNLGMADGSVQQATSAGLSAALVNSSFATNRLVIP